MEKASHTAGRSSLLADSARRLHICAHAQRAMPVLSWVYEGAERDYEEDSDLSNVQLGTAGCTLMHDIFGLCTHLDDGEGVATGAFK
eukprot:545044-Pleurochrysis_carterae.AAC.1